MTREPLKFVATKSDLAYIHQALDRVYGKVTPMCTDRLTAVMDLDACHSNGCPLDFKQLAESKYEDLFHDVVGITANIDRSTGKLGGGFTPRCAINKPPSVDAPQKISGILDAPQKISGILGALGRADAVYIAGSPLLTTWQVIDIKLGDPDEEVLVFVWEEDGEDFTEVITLFDLQTCRVYRNTVIFHPGSDTDEFRLELYTFTATITQSLTPLEIGQGDR